MPSVEVYLSPIYIYQCPDCGKVWNEEFAPGMGGAMCRRCNRKTTNIIAKNYEHGTETIVQ